MELQACPAGVNIYTHRGAANLVRITDSKLFRALQNDLPVQSVPNTPGAFVPHHVVEAIYARAFAPDGATGARTFGLSIIDVAAFNRLENTLTNHDFDFSPCTVGS